MINWQDAVHQVITKTTKNGILDRLEIIDFLVTHQTISISMLTDKCGGGYRRDNRFINPITKIVHGQARRNSDDDWLPLDQDTAVYSVNPAFAKAWKEARGL